MFFSTRRSPTTTGTDRARYKLDRQRVSYLGICTHLANARCHADISRSYNRRISSMEDVIIIERRTSRLHQRSRSSSSRSPRECHRSRTAHHPGKRRKSTGAFIFSCRLPAARAIATRGPLLCQIRRRHQPARMPPFATGRNRVTSGQSTEAGRPTDSVNLSLGCLIFCRGLARESTSLSNRCTDWRFK